MWGHMPWRDCHCAFFSFSVLHLTQLSTPFGNVHFLELYSLGWSLYWPSMSFSMCWDLFKPMFDVLWWHCFLCQMSSWYILWCILMESHNQKLFCLTQHRSNILWWFSFCWLACLIAQGSSYHLFFFGLLLLGDGCHIHSLQFRRWYGYF